MEYLETCDQLNLRDVSTFFWNDLDFSSRIQIKFPIELGQAENGDKKMQIWYKCHSRIPLIKIYDFSEMIPMTIRCDFDNFLINISTRYNFCSHLSRPTPGLCYCLKQLTYSADVTCWKNNDDFLNRLADAVEIAFFEGKGELQIENISNPSITIFNNRFEADGISFLSPNIHLFSFNNPYGACNTCEGYGDVIGIDNDLVIPNTALSVFENAIFPWRGESMSWYRDQLVNAAYKFDFPIHKAWFELSEDQKLLVWEGNEHFRGLNDFFEELTSKSYKIQNRVMLSR
jgi:hypothetical protein